MLLLVHVEGVRGDHLLLGVVAEVGTAVGGLHIRLLTIERKMSYWPTLSLPSYLPSALSFSSWDVRQGAQIMPVGK